MPRKRIVPILACSILAFSFFVLIAFGQNKAGDDFPLTQGTYWVYQGFVRSAVKGADVGKTTRVTWKTEVARAIRRNGLTIAVVKGMPGDLDWSEGTVAPKLSAIIRSRDAKFYLIEKDEAKSVIAQIDNPRYSWNELPIDDDWFLELPLAQGKKFCDPAGMQREDGEYCWVTGAGHAIALVNVKGIPPGKQVAYRVEFRTNPDDMEFDFVPGIGMVTYEYHHHGTIADTELHLIEFHAGNSTP